MDDVGTKATTNPKRLYYTCENQCVERVFEHKILHFILTYDMFS